VIGVLLLATVCGFQEPVRYASASVQAVLVRDLNGDGAPDIIASGNQVDELGAFSLFVNRGDGTFQPERMIASGFGQKIEDVADFNGDGIRDLLASDYWSNGIATYVGHPGLQFDSGTAFGTATHGGPSIATDYDGDGRTDILTFSFGSGNPVRLHLFHGNGDGTFAPKMTFETGLANAASPSMRVAGGALELLVNERSQRLGLLRYANGTLSVSTVPVGPGFNLTSTFADINGDGIEDIIDTTDDQADPREPIFIDLGNADGSFGARRRLTTPRSVTLPVVIRAADLDGDGRVDLVGSDFQISNLYWWRGDGTGNFAAARPIDAGGPVDTFVLADVNGDGRADLISANNDRTISVIINAGPCGPRRRAARH